VPVVGLVVWFIAMQQFVCIVGSLLLFFIFAFVFFFKYERDQQFITDEDIAQAMIESPTQPRLTSAESDWLGVPPPLE
jgi:hypothetical protein